MADYGLKVWGPGGNLTLDVADNITRLRYSVEEDADTTDSVVLSDIDGKVTVQFSIRITVDTQNQESFVAAGPDYYPHTVTRSGTTITWTTTNAGAAGKNLILVFITD